MLKSSFFLPHTLKVNELPTHTHSMPGYWYGGVGSSYTFLALDTYDLRLSWNDGTAHPDQIKVNNADKVARYRAFSLGGGGEGDPTTETGNNERTNC